MHLVSIHPLVGISEVPSFPSLMYHLEGDFSKSCSDLWAFNISF